MQKTTVYLPDDLKAALARTARQRGVAEAEVIREAVAAVVARPRPRPGIIVSDEPFADRAHDLLRGFGER